MTAGGFDPAAALARLRRAWSRETSGTWRADNPALGQCNVTAMMLHRLHGLEMRKTLLPAGWHFYNWHDGTRLDLTASQFAGPVPYDDLPATADEAHRGVTDAELDALTARYLSE